MLRGQHDRIVVSTLAEARLIRSRCPEVRDILYGLPIAAFRIPEAARLNLQLLTDHPDQIQAIMKYREQDITSSFDVFIKTDCGYGRAGVDPNSSSLVDLIQAVLAQKDQGVRLVGFYTHSGHSYHASAPSEIFTALQDELNALTAAYKHVEAHGLSTPMILSFGATPTASILNKPLSINVSGKIPYELELHAGNYPIRDIQQISRGVSGLSLEEGRCAATVLARVISVYTGRGTNGTDEILVDAGALAMSKDNGDVPLFGCMSAPYGWVVKPLEGKPFGKLEQTSWVLGRVSQEHGVLTCISKDATAPPIGSTVRILMNHACLTAANFSEYRVIDSSTNDKEVVITTYHPCRGW